jgi:hypothetical protein
MMPNTPLATERKSKDDSRMDPINKKTPAYRQRKERRKY